MNTMYETGKYLEKNPEWHVEDSQWKVNYILKILDLNSSKINSICEIGCGAGEILRQLQIQLDDEKLFYGYEISPQAFELCRGRKNDKLKFSMENMLEEKKTHFDVLLAIDVFEHVENYFDFLRKLRSKGTYKIFHIPLDLSVLSLLRNWIMGRRKDVGHLHYFTKETSLATLQETGYEIIDYFYTPTEVNPPVQNLKMTLLKLPRKCLFVLNKDFAVRMLGGFSLMVLTK